MIPVLSLFYSAEDEHQETGINSTGYGKLTCDERAWIATNRALSFYAVPVLIKITIR